MKKILLTIVLFLLLMPTVYAKDILNGTYMAATAEEPVGRYGCTDKEAKNYNSQATVNRGCEYWKYGCMDEKAINYDPEAEIDNGSCLFPSVNSTVAPNEKESNMGKVVGTTFGVTALIGGAYYILRKKIII